MGLWHASQSCILITSYCTGPPLPGPPSCPIYKRTGRLAIVEGDSNDPIDVTLEYGADFTGSGNNELRLTFSLDPAAQDGSEDLLAIAGSRFSTIPAGLFVTDIDNGLVTGATVSLSTATSAAVVGEEVGLIITQLPHVIEVTQGSEHTRI